MYSWVKLSHLAHWSGGKLLHPLKKDPAVTSISTDTRTLKKGEVFLALRGENFDGHKFLEAAAKKGASLLITEEEIKTKVPVLLVSNSLLAFANIAEKLREGFRGPVFAVTGSAGKSSTRDMVATLLGANTLKAPASFNNLLGVSKTLCLIEDSTEKIVLEMGMNALGEIQDMCDHFHPMAGLITNIGDAHLGKLGSQENVFRAKKELFDSISKSQKAIGAAVNLDDPYVVRAHQETIGAKLKAVTYSLKDPKADVFVSPYVLDPKTCYLKLTVIVGKDTFSADLKIFGLHHAQNVAGAIASALLLGVPLSDIESRLPGILPAVHRGEVRQLKNGVTLIDESYNSNPAALRSSLESLWTLDPARRRVIVIGEMREMGEFSEKVHREAGEHLVELHERKAVPFLLIAVGKDTKFLSKAVREKLPAVKCIDVETQEIAQAETKKLLQKGDVLFVKGSHGVRLDLLVDQFVLNFQ